MQRLPTISQISAAVSVLAVFRAAALSCPGVFSLGTQGNGEEVYSVRQSLFATPIERN